MTDKKTDMLFAAGEKTAQEQHIKDVSSVPEKGKVNWSKVRKLVSQLMIAGIAIPFCAVMATGVYRIAEELVNTIEMSQNVSVGGEFDPALGERISSENGRALVVVHEGYNLEINPRRYESDIEYQEYLRILEAKKELYYANGDIVIEVVNNLALQNEIVNLTPRQNTMYLVTTANTGVTMPSFINDGVGYLQTISVWDILKDRHVHRVEIAGEFRAGCATQVFGKAEISGLEAEWCQDCVFPTISQEQARNLPLSNYPDDLK